MIPLARNQLEATLHFSKGFIKVIKLIKVISHSKELQWAIASRGSIELEVVCFCYDTLVEIYNKVSILKNELKELSSKLNIFNKLSFETRKQEVEFLEKLIKPLLELLHVKTDDATIMQSIESIKLILKNNTTWSFTSETVNIVLKIIERLSPSSEPEKCSVM